MHVATKCRPCEQTARAVMRAALQGDQDAAGTVAENMTWPHLTAAVLAQWIAILVTTAGLSPDDAMTVLGAWQQEAGLS
ncbi:MAG TPA: hypothetical protein VF223_16925 [Trebonia sp.]